MRHICLRVVVPWSSSHGQNAARAEWRPSQPCAFRRQTLGVQQSERYSGTDLRGVTVD